MREGDGCSHRAAGDCWGLLLFIAIGGEIVRQLWNWLLPPLFGWPPDHLLAGAWTAGAVPDPLRRIRAATVLRSLQFPPSHGRALGAHDPEERERFRQGMRGRWGFGPSTSESKGQ